MFAGWWLPVRPVRSMPCGKPTDGRPDAVIDLRTKEGADLVRGQWRYADARLSEVDSHGPGPDLRPSGPAVRTLDVMPKGGGADIDDSGWQKIAATSLEARRTNGKLSFNWYRINITIPARVGAFDTTGSTVIFEVVVDDYAEIWVDGKLPRPLGQTGGALVKGFNAPNRVVLTRNARPNQTDPTRRVRRERTAVGSAVKLHLDSFGDAGFLQGLGRRSPLT